MFGNAAASLTRRRNTREVEALQVRMRRQVSGSEIELHRIARLRDGWAGRGQAQVFEDLLDRGALSQKGDQRHATAAAFAAQDVDAEDPLEQLRPRNPGRCLRNGGRYCSGGRSRGCTRGRWRALFERWHDLLASSCVGREDAVEANQMVAKWWDQRGELAEELRRGEEQLSAPVGDRALEAVADSPDGKHGEAFERK